MRKLLTPANLVCVVIIAAVAAMITVANWRDVRRSRVAYTRPALAGTRGIGTSRESLEQRVADLRTRLAQHPQDVGVAIMLGDALLRQARTTGNAGLAIEAERSLKGALDGDVANYDANRVFGAVYLSQHRFRDAIAIAERNRMPAERLINYGIGAVSRAANTSGLHAFDRMVRCAPAGGAYARGLRTSCGKPHRRDSSHELATDATAADDVESLAWHHCRSAIYLRLGSFTKPR